MYTEDEAKGKWCPEARVVTGKIEGDNIRLDAMTTTYNRIKVPGDEPLGVQGATCIGSDCMEWRWVDNRLCGLNNDDKGYCGLGGAPRG